MHMAFCFKRYTTITAALVYLFTALTPGAQGVTTHAKTTHAHRRDCLLVAKTDRTLCAQVQRQRAYGWTYGPNGEGLATNPSGIVDVHDATHQGLTRQEMHNYLTGYRDQYREHVTHVTVNVDKIKPGCAVTIRVVKREGIRVTDRRTVCP